LADTPEVVIVETNPGSEDTEYLRDIIDGSYYVRDDLFAFTNNKPVYSKKTYLLLFSIFFFLFKTIYYFCSVMLPALFFPGGGSPKTFQSKLCREMFWCECFALTYCFFYF
jgi:hypothetical protein